jgi:hypothetical protein
MHGLAAFVPASQPIFKFAIPRIILSAKTLVFKQMFLNYW